VVVLLVIVLAVNHLRQRRRAAISI
jgi:hypothetical protein